MKVKVLIGGVDYTKFAEIPFQRKAVLDESLDMASIRLFYTDKKDEFEPFTLVEITIEDDITETFKKYIASDVTEEVLSTGKVNHTLVFIEETKSIERLLLTKTTTNPIAKDFTDAQTLAIPQENYVDADFSYNEIYTPSNYLTPLKVGEFNVVALKDLVNSLANGRRYLIELKSPTGKVLFSTTSESESATVQITQSGEHTLSYKWTRVGQKNVQVEIVYKFNFVSSSASAVDKTITYVVNNLLESCETIRKGDKTQFIFNKEQAEFYNNVNCPEMTFSKQTLWEALRQIGGVIHAIPRLKDNEVYFDSYDSIVYSDIAKKKPISKTGTFDVEQFCSTIESSVDNLIQADDSSQGAIEDYGEFFKTARTEQINAQITESNMFIKTALSIGKVLKAEAGYLPDGTYVGDITNYIFERKEYDTLSSYDETYPTSKALALFYREGERNIGGLVFKVEDAFSSIFRNTAIENIIRHKLSNQDPNWWNNLWTDYNEFELQFRITYQPYYSATLRQVKPNLKDLKFKSVLSYTQGANSISTQSYGEHLKGAVARLGTPEKRITYILKHLSEVPNVGDKFDKDYRISEVSCEYYKDYIICEIGLSKKFNRWSDFVGVNNELRMYEVSEKQVSERPVIWEDYAVIQKTSDNKPRTEEEKQLIENDYQFIGGIWNGTEFVLSAKDVATVWVGEDKRFNKVGVIDEAGVMAVGYDSLENPLVLVASKNFSNNISYLTYEDGEIKTQSFPLGMSAKVESISFASSSTREFRAIANEKIANEPIKVIGAYAQTSGLTNFAVILELDNQTSWRIGKVSNKFLVIGDKGKSYYSSIENNDWIEETMPTIEGLIDVVETNTNIYAFNNKILLKATFENGFTWQQFNLPATDIVDFGIFEDIFVAISKDKVYYSLDLNKWWEHKPDFKEMKKLVIGNKILIFNETENVLEFQLKGSDTIFTQQGVYNVGNSLINGISQPINLVNAKTYDSSDNLMYDYWFPVVASATGNTMQLQFEYVDNFSAGTYANTDSNGAKTQTYAQYGNLFGEAKYLSVEFFDENPFVYNADYETYRKAGDNLPIIDLERNENVKSVLNSSCNLYRGNKNHILLNKDNREKIKFTYCLHYVANDDDIVVGSGLARMNAFVLRYSGELTNVNPLARVYILNREIGEFEKSVDLTDAVEQESSIRCYIDTEFGKLRFRAKDNETMLADGKSWVIVIKNPYNKEQDLLLFGKNVEFKQGDLASDVWADYEIAFTHNVDEYL